MNTSQQILSESALEALLDRNFTNNKLQKIDKESSEKHCEFFKVIDEEQESAGSTLKGVTNKDNDNTLPKDDNTNDDNTLPKDDSTILSHPTLL